MAELVESHIASMSEEMAEMIRIKLFTQEETRIISKKRKEFEYKINGLTKNLQDFKDYINYEKVILKDIKIRRNRMRIMERKNAIEFKISRRIKYLYDIAIQRFSNDYQLFMSYFKFCKESEYMRAASHVMQTMIKSFSNKEDVWKEAADWYMKKDFNQALTVVYRGLAIHKKSTVLISKAIDLELKNVKPEKEVLELCAKRIDAIIKSMLQNINDYKFLLEVLQTLTHHSFTENNQKSIVKCLLEKYKDEELVWQAIAEREFNGHHFIEPPPDQKYSQSRLEKCIATYEKGLKEICIANKSALWSMYLDFLIEYHYKPDQTAPMDKKTVIFALERSSACTYLTDRYFVIWAQLLDDQTKVMEVIDKGLAAVPDSVELWKLRLKYAILEDDVNEFNALVKRATAILKNNSLPLFTMALRYHTLNSPDHVIEQVYKDIINTPQEVSDVFKSDYIEWLALTKGIDHARRKYEELSKESPPCKELHVTMARLESLEMNPNIDHWEQVLLLATQQIKEDLDLWKMLVELYLRQNKQFEKKRKDFVLSEKLMDVYSRALQAVKHNDLLMANWKKEFDELRNSINV